MQQGQISRQRERGRTDKHGGDKKGGLGQAAGLSTRPLKSPSPDSSLGPHCFPPRRRLREVLIHPRVPLPHLLQPCSTLRGTAQSCLPPSAYSMVWSPSSATFQAEKVPQPQALNSFSCTVQPRIEGNGTHYSHSEWLGNSFCFST